MQPRIAIIGAGCSGITAVKNLAEAGLTNLVCFEKGNRLGGNWVYTAAEGHSSVCETTHIISSKTLSQYSDFPMPSDYPDYPSHKQVLQYFENYAHHFGVEKYIRFNTAVAKAQKTHDECWELTLSDGSVETFNYLLVANGHHAVPRHPSWKDQFTGTYKHAHSFKNNHDMAGKKVLVVGAGNSGCDCAVESSRVAERVDISVRSPQYIVPKFMMGKPTDTFAKGVQWIPGPIRNVIQTLSLRLQIGRYRDYGLPEPDFPPTKAHPTVNSELLDKLRHGKVFSKPGISHVEGQTVHFADGSSADYDVIVAATGYKVAFPFFSHEFINWEDAGSVPLYQRVFHPEHASLFFIGLVQPQGCVWPLSEAQSRLVARLLTGQVALPSDWKKQAYEEAKNIEKLFLKQIRHAFEVHYYPYLRKLTQLARA
ncbi:MAG: NAD(P)-binding domain-containing protein [Saprospiraceae bacterium]|nr:NAD(P)-binding domain-containing protein [Saprospiraceae bacterium]